MACSLILECLILPQGAEGLGSSRGPRVESVEHLLYTLPWGFRYHALAPSLCVVFPMGFPTHVKAELPRRENRTPLPPWGNLVMRGSCSSAGAAEVRPPLSSHRLQHSSSDSTKVTSTCQKLENGDNWASPWQGAACLRQRFQGKKY